MSDFFLCLFISNGFTYYAKALPINLKERERERGSVCECVRACVITLKPGPGTDGTEAAEGAAGAADFFTLLANRDFFSFYKNERQVTMGDITSVVLVIEGRQTRTRAPCPSRAATELRGRWIS